MSAEGGIVALDDGASIDLPAGAVPAGVTVEAGLLSGVSARCDGKRTMLPLAKNNDPETALINADGTVYIDLDRMVWHEGRGTPKPLTDLLAAAGLDLTGRGRLDIVAMTPDARVLAGSLDTTAIRIVLPAGTL